MTYILSLYRLWERLSRAETHWGGTGERSSPGDMNNSYGSGSWSSNLRRLKLSMLSLEFASLFGQAVSNCLVGDSCYFSKFSQLSNVYGLTPISSFKVTVSGRQVFSCDAGNQPKKIFRQPLNYVEILSRQKLIALLAP